jgi:hypothetical protein
MYAAFSSRKHFLVLGLFYMKQSLSTKYSQVKIFTQLLTVKSLEKSGGHTSRRNPFAWPEIVYKYM